MVLRLIWIWGIWWWYLFFSFEPEITLLRELVQLIKALCVWWNLVSRLIQIFWIHWWRSFFVIGTEISIICLNNTKYNNNSNMLNLMVFFFLFFFVFSFELRMHFWPLFRSKNQNCLFNHKQLDLKAIL